MKVYIDNIKNICACILDMSVCILYACTSKDKKMKKWEVKRAEVKLILTELT